MPNRWKETPEEDAEGDQDEASSSKVRNMASCNVILPYKETPGSDSDDVLTPQEHETFNAEESLKNSKVEEVNMNLSGGKVLPDFVKAKQRRTDKLY